jgi:hypothetical protein
LMMLLNRSSSFCNIIATDYQFNYDYLTKKVLNGLLSPHLGIANFLFRQCLSVNNTFKIAS